MSTRPTSSSSSSMPPPPPSTPDYDQTPTRPSFAPVLAPQPSPLRQSSPAPPPSSTASGSSPHRSPRLDPPSTPTTAVPPLQQDHSPTERRRNTRARDLLRKHYGMTVGPPAPSGKPSDPMDIDSPAFNAKAYYEQLITTSSFPVLLKRANELHSEIRELDGERQSLVYNHHHELIAASDTINAVKNRAESLDADLDKLKAAFSEISRLNAQVTFEERSSASDQSSWDARRTHPT